MRRLVAFALPLDDAAERVVEDWPGHDVETEDRETLARAQHAIAALPTAPREVLVSRTIEGSSQGGVAAALGVSEKAVETRLRRARLRLSERLDR